MTGFGAGTGGRCLSAPGEDGLLEVVDPLAGSAEQADLPQLEEDRCGRRVDEVVAKRQLQDWAVALRYRDEPWLAVSEGVQADAVDRENLVGRRIQLGVFGAPQHDRR